MHPDVQRIQEMSVKELVEQGGPICETLSAEGWQAMLEKVWIEGTEEDAVQFVANQYNHVKKLCLESPDGKGTLFADETAERIVDATNRAAQTVATAWEER